MNYSINLKNIKNSAYTLEKYLNEKDCKITHALALESVSKVLNLNNWNTAQAMCLHPNQIVNHQIQKRYIFEITANCSIEQLKKILKDALVQSNCDATLGNYRSKENHHSFELDCANKDKNTITFIIVACNRLMEEKIEVQEFDYCRISVEKESFMKYVNSKNPKP